VAPIPAGGRQRVQLLAADDLAPILFATAQRHDLHRRCVFAAGDTVTLGDLMREIAALRTPPAQTLPVPGIVFRLLGLVESVRGTLTRTAPRFNPDKAREMLEADWLCDAEPLLRELRMAMATRWREGLRRTCRWYVDARWLARQRFASV
jgi:nucleoside-diphosphate-sugar epimerase